MPKPSKQPALADWGELRFLEWVRRTMDPPGSAVPVGIGDDAALIRVAAGRGMVVTTDALVEGVHFRRKWISSADLGHKALAVNLSDLAAKAAQPVAAFLSMGVPPRTPLDDLKGFFLGLRAEGRTWGCPLVGGDLVRAPVWMISIMAVGAPMRRDGTIPRRSCLKPGMRLYVTGSPGESAAGLEALRRGMPHARGEIGRLVRRHARPTPRLGEARILSRICPDLVMIDVSDGIMNEARHLARESGVGIEIDAERLPISNALRAFGRRSGINPMALALFGGEDYELLFASSVLLPKKQKCLSTEIGRVFQGKGVVLKNAPRGIDKNEHAAFRHF